MKNYIRDKPKGKNNSNKFGINIIIYLNKFILLYLILIKSVNSNTIAQLFINGIGKQQILSNGFERPQEIYVNGEIQNYTEYYDLNKSENIIIMKWNNQLENLNGIFSNIRNIIKIDFSNGILSVFNIRSICSFSSLISLNLTNFSINSSSYDGMQDMFSYCNSLKSLNLNNFL